MDPNALTKMRRKATPLHKQQSTPSVLGKGECTINITYKIGYRWISTQHTHTNYTLGHDIVKTLH